MNILFDSLSFLTSLLGYSDDPRIFIFGATFLLIGLSIWTIIIASTHTEPVPYKHKERWLIFFVKETIRYVEEHRPLWALLVASICLFFVGNGLIIYEAIAITRNPIVTQLHYESSPYEQPFSNRAQAPSLTRRH